MDQNKEYDQMLKTLFQCKTDYMKDKLECEKLRDTNTKLWKELKESRENEESLQSQLVCTRETIENLQEQVSHLVYLKKDNKKLKEEIQIKDSAMDNAKKERQILIEKHSTSFMEVKRVHEQILEEIKITNLKKVEQAENEADTKVAQLNCVIEELRAKMKDMVTEHRDNMNVMVLEYEEQLQRSAAQVTQLGDQQAALVARSDANIDAYRRKVQEMEEKLKLSQAKQLVTRPTFPPQYDTETQQVERPYSAPRDHYQYVSTEFDPVFNLPKPKPLVPIASQQNQIRFPNPGVNRLQVNYYNAKSPDNKKGPFNLVKKRKLYNNKDF